MIADKHNISHFEFMKLVLATVFTPVLDNIIEKTDKAIERLPKKKFNDNLLLTININNELLVHSSSPRPELEYPIDQIDEENLEILKDLAEYQKIVREEMIYIKDMSNDYFMKVIKHTDKIFDEYIAIFPDELYEHENFSLYKELKKKDRSALNFEIDPKFDEIIIKYLNLALIL